MGSQTKTLPVSDHHHSFIQNVPGFLVLTKVSQYEKTQTKLKLQYFYSNKKNVFKSIHVVEAEVPKHMEPLVDFV